MRATSSAVIVLLTVSTVAIGSVRETGILRPDAEDVVLEERIDLYDPTSGAFMGAERTWFGPDGRRLRLEITNDRGGLTLFFILRHDDQGREVEAYYFEEGSEDLSRESFTWSDRNRLRTTTYYYQPGVAADRTESVLNEYGREIAKRYFRADGTQYGEEDVLWNDDGSKAGWDFRYVGRDGGASFRYRYDDVDRHGEWVRRTRFRDGQPERLEVRTRTTLAFPDPLPTPVPFSPGVVSTAASETSPSFTHDGRTMVFARYGDDWEEKQPFLATLEEGGWRIEPLPGIGSVYNLAIAPDGGSVYYASGAADDRRLYRIQRTTDGWSAPEDLSRRYGINGTYPCLTAEGDLNFYNSDGPSGAGIFLAPREGTGFGRVRPVFVPARGGPFDVYRHTNNSPLLVTMCFDGLCLTGPENGIWEVSVPPTGEPESRKLPGLPYAWGAQPVMDLGLLVFTDGEDILALPLAAVGIPTPPAGVDKE